MAKKVGKRRKQKVTPEVVFSHSMPFYADEDTEFSQRIITTQVLRADARDLNIIADKSVDLVVTSPPYWRKRDYGASGQIGQETKVEDYVDAIIAAMKEWRRVLRPTGSIFLNIGDTYHNLNLMVVPGRVEIAAQQDNWTIRNRIIWAKDGGMPNPAQNRLAGRHEYIIHFTQNNQYYYDAFGYSMRFGNGNSAGDVWQIKLERNMGGHLAPYPEELVERIVTLACPHAVCAKCGQPRSRILRRTDQLDPDRPQARRAMELAEEKGLTPAHIAAIQATGISDAGKALKIQNGTGRNSDEVKTLAAEAKEALGGYFREFTFAKKETVGWTTCDCDADVTPGVVLDPFMGTGTTLRVAARLGHSSIGADIIVPQDFDPFS